MTVHFVFVDDGFAAGGDAENYRRLLQLEGQLEVSGMVPDRDALLVPESQLPANIDGFILDINLRDIAHEGQRFVGTGAGLAQDLRLLQTAGGADGQRPRPIVRLCAAQVFQRYLAGADTTEDVFDLGFSKETIGDIAAQARREIACLPELYAGITDARVDGDACDLLGLSEEAYGRLHSAFRSSLELELTRKPHETANFFIRFFLQPPGLLISEDLLAVRLGIDREASAGWPSARARFDAARYEGRGATGFPRWWSAGLATLWSEIDKSPLYQLTAQERVERLLAGGLSDLVPIAGDARSPGDRPWNIAQSDDPDLVLPADPAFSYNVLSMGKPWLDDNYWSLEQAKRNRDAAELPAASRERLKADLKRVAAKPE